MAGATTARIAGLLSAAWLLPFCAPARKLPERVSSGRCEFGAAQSLSPVEAQAHRREHPCPASDRAAINIVALATCR